MNLSWLKTYNLLIFDEIDSTNSEAIRLAKARVSGDFIIWAENQTAGRGQYGRSWESGAGNLHMSFLLNRNIHITLQPQLSFVTAVALHDTISHFAKESAVNLNIGLKWPNDVLINGDKVAGILLESLRAHDRNYLIVGVGVNIASTPESVTKPVTSLVAGGIKVQESSYFLDVFVNYFDKHFLQWERYGFIKTRKLWLSRAVNINQAITVDNGIDRISGIFKDIDLNGNMKVELASGQVCSFGAGDVLFEKA